MAQQLQAIMPPRKRTTSQAAWRRRTCSRRRLRRDRVPARLAGRPALSRQSSLSAPA
jgi:hypothetical protein